MDFFIGLFLATVGLYSLFGLIRRQMGHEPFVGMSRLQIFGIGLAIAVVATPITYGITRLIS